MKFTFIAQLWVDRRRRALLTLLTLPPEVGETILEVVDGATNGWGSVRVDVRIGQTRWRTSIFPTGPDGAYIVPVKRAVRTAEGLDVDAIVKVGLEVVDF